MASIAQAVVTVQPDLTGFAKSLREQLRKQIDSVGASARTITITATLESGTKTKLQKQLTAITGLTVQVTPVLAPNARGALSRQLGQIPIDVTLASGQAQQIGRNVGQQISSAAPVIGTGEATGASVALAKQEAKRAGAVEAEIKAQIALNEALADTTVSLEAVQVAEAKAATATANLAAETEALALARQEASRPIVTADQQAQLDREAAAAAAATAANEAAAETAARRAAVNKASLAAEQAVTDLTLKGASARGIDNAATSASIAIKEQLRNIDREIAAARAADDVGLAEELTEHRATTAALLQEVEARRLLEQSFVTRGTLGGLGPATNEKELADLRRLSKKSETLAEEGLNRALETNNVNLKANAELNLEAAQAATARVNANAAGLLTAAEQRKVDERLLTLQTRINQALHPDTSLVARKAELLAIEKSATAQAELYAKSTLGSAAANEKAALAVATHARQLRQQTVEQIAANKAIQSNAATLASAQKGIFASTAGFLGLRGAVLAASQGFIIGAVAVAAFAKIVGTAAQLEQSLNVFAAVSEATADQMARVSDEARALGADLTLPATSANDAATAMTTLAKAGLSVEDSINAARGALQLAAAADTDVVSAATAIATELNAFGLAGTEAVRVADLLAGAANAAQGEISDFVLAFSQVNAVANQVQLPLETTATILTEFARAGLRSSDAGTSLRTFLLRLVPTTKTAAKAMDELGISINKNIPIGAQFTDLVDQYSTALAKLAPIAQQEILTKIFGQDAIRAATITFREGSAALEDLQGQVARPGQAAEFAEARMKGLSGSIEALKSELETLAASLGAILSPALQEIVDKLANIARVAAESVQALRELGNIGPGGLNVGSAFDAISGPAATAAIAAGALFAVRKLVEIRVERQRMAAAAQRDATLILERDEISAAGSATAYLEADAAIQASSNRTRDVKIRNATIATDTEISLAKQRASANIAADAAGALDPKKGGLLRGLGRGAAGGGAALIGGIALSEIGSQTGHENIAKAGGILQAAGTGAAIGSIVPGVGTAVGAIALGGLATIGAIRQSSEEKEQELRDKFHSMSPQQQRDFLRVFFPERSKDAVGEDLRALAESESEILGGTARQFIASAGGFGNDENTKLLAALDKKTAEDKATVQRIFNNLNPAPFEQLKQAFRDRDQNLDDIFANRALGILSPQGDPDALAKASLNTISDNAAELQLQTAEAAHDVDGQTAALDLLAEANDREIAHLETMLAKEDPFLKFAFFLNGQKRQDAIAALDKAKQEQDQISQKTLDLLTDTPFQEEMQALVAQGTEGLGDNAAAAQATVDRLNKAHDKAVQDFQKGTLSKEDFESFLKTEQTARNSLTSATKAVADKAASDAKTAQQNAEKAADARIAALRFAADQAGNVGKAEDALLAALKKRRDEAKRGTPEYIEAAREYQQELDKQESAVEDIADARKSLRDKRLTNLLAIAETTPGTDDNKRIIKQMIENNNKDIAIIQARIDSGKLTTKELLKEQDALADERADNFSLFQKLKGTTGGAGGLTIGDIFQSAIENFREFGGGRKIGSDTPLSPQDVRGDVALNLIRNAPQAQLDKLLARFHQDSSQQATSQLGATLETNRLLRRGFGIGVRTGTGQIRYGIGGARAVNSEGEFIPGDMRVGRGN